MKEILKGIKSKTKQHLKNPGAVFGLIYPYILVVGLILGIYYVKNLDNIARQSVPPVIQDTTVVKDLAIKNAVDVPPVNVFELSKSTPELVAEGEKLFKSNCTSCHGENGTGGGPAAAGLNPAPRNFTSMDNWVNGTKISQIYTTLQEGIPPSAMASYEYLLPEQKFALAQYLRATFIPKPATDTDADLRALDATFNLSAGQQIPAQIPVSAATELIIKENETQLNKVDQAIALLEKLRNDNDYKVFKDVTTNQKIALEFLKRNNSWQGNVNDFINLVINNVNQNGFNGSVFSLDKDEWASLQKFLVKII
jgi:mono/diheme cytochrome c family protein